MGWVIPTPTSPEADATWEHGLSVDDVTGVRPVTDRLFLSTTCQFSMSHVCPSSCNDFLAMVAMKPGLYLAGLACQLQELTRRLRLGTSA